MQQGIMQFDPGISPCSALLAWALPIFLHSNGRGADCTQADFSGPQLVPGYVGFAETGQAVNPQSGSAAVATSTRRTAAACRL